MARVDRAATKKFREHPSLLAFFRSNVTLRELKPGVVVAVGGELNHNFRPAYLNQVELERFMNADEKLLAVAFNRKTNAFEPLISCGLNIAADHLWLHTLRSAETKPVDEAARRKIKTYFFRAIIDPAVAIAREHGFSEIRLHARNLELVKYYSTMNFKFEDPHDPLLGVFRFGKKARKVKRLQG
ncbi:MAG: hypothetical protein NUV67_03815 [archaeon]|nr:hypothetical protein [archaeon]